MTNDEFMQFLGNQKAFSFLQKSLERDQVNHAYIFSGPEHVGKFTLAQMFALHAVDGTKLDLEIENVGKDALFDLIVVAPEIAEKNGISKQRSIPIEFVREAQKNLSLFPYHGKRKVLIVDDAHKMNVAAQNALLKILEEPNQTTMIILVTSDSGNILPTVRSRCQTINFSLVSDAEIGNFFPQETVSLSAGRPGLVKIMNENGEERSFRAEAVGNLNRIIAGSINERLSLAEEMSKDIARTSDKLNFWLWEMRKIALLSGNDECKNIYDIMEKIQKSMTMLKNTNANARLVLETLFMDM